MLAQHYAVERYNNEPERKWDKQYMDYPFQINLIMINGSRFFEYIQRYITIYSKLFIGKNAILFNHVEKCTNYKGWHRVGDGYVRMLFFCTVLYYYDKFGDIELEKAAKICLRWSYFLRLQHGRIGINTVNNYAIENDGLIKVITKSLHPQQVLQYQPQQGSGFKVAGWEKIKEMVWGENNE